MLPFIWLPSQVMLYLTIIKKYIIYEHTTNNPNPNRPQSLG
jgi:hypothetical protein